MFTVYFCVCVLYRWWTNTRISIHCNHIHIFPFSTTFLVLYTAKLECKINLITCVPPKPPVGKAAPQPQKSLNQSLPAWWRNFYFVAPCIWIVVYFVLEHTYTSYYAALLREWYDVCSNISKNTVRQLFLSMDMWQVIRVHTLCRVIDCHLPW